MPCKLLLQAGAADAANSATTSYQWDPLSQTLLGDGTNEYVDSAGGGLLVQTPTAGGASAAQYGIADALGSTRLLTNSSAQTQGTLAYDAFGVPKAPSGGSGTATSPLGFTGQLTDGESGLVDLRARLYDPTTGQFTSRDSYAGSASNPLSLNLYTYGANDPTRLTDPSGHNPVASAFDWLVAAGCAVGGPALANNLRILQWVSSIAIGFIPGVGDAYFLLSAVAGQDLLTGTQLSLHERQVSAGLATLSLATMILGPGLFSQEAVAAERTVTELGELERLGSQLSHGVETELRAAGDEARAAEGVARDVAGGGDLVGGGGGAAGGHSSWDDLAQQYADAIHNQVGADWPYEGKPDTFRVTVGFVGEGNEVTTVVSANRRFFSYKDADQVLASAAAKVLPEEGSKLVTWDRWYESRYFGGLKAHGEEFVDLYVREGNGKRQLLGIGVNEGPKGPGDRICTVCVGMLRQLRDAGLSSSGWGG